MTRLLLLGFFFTSFNQLVAQTDWDRILKQMNDSIAVGSLNYVREHAMQYLLEAKTQENAQVIGKLYFGMALGYYRSDPLAGIPFLDSSIYYSEKGAGISNQIRALNAKSSFLKKLGRFKEAKKTSLEAFRLSGLGAGERLFLSAWNVSINYRYLGQYDSALFYITIADSLAQSSTNKRDQYLALQGASNIYLDMRNYDKALQTIRRMPEGTSQGDQMYEELNLGLAYLGLNRPDSALMAFETALSIAVAQKDSIEQANLLAHLTSTYMELNLPDKAIESVRHSLKISVKQETFDIVAKNYLVLAALLLGQDQTEEAIPVAEEALRLAIMHEYVDFEIDALSLLARAHAMQEEHKMAYQYLQQYQELHERRTDEEKVAKVEELKTIYELQQREQKIAALAQENTIKDLQLGQQRIVLIASGVVFLLVVIAVVLFIRQYHAKAKERQLSLEQDVLRIQMNPHFIFNALASIQGFITRNKRKEAATYLAKFGELTRDILEASRLELIPIKKELEMIRNYISLENARFSKSLKLDVELKGIDPDDELLVPPMMIQPFLENAIKHGFKERESGNIVVGIEKNEQLLHLSVMDDGVGIQRDQPISDKSLAIQITQDRLNHMKKYTKNLQLSINNVVEDDGTVVGVRVTFDLPIVYAH